MKRKTRNGLIIILFLIVFFLSIFVAVFSYLDRKETERVFNIELSLFDRALGVETPELMRRSLESLFQAADTPGAWLRLIKRGYAYGSVYGDYSLYMDSALLASSRFSKNRTLSIFLFDALYINDRIPEFLETLRRRGMPEQSDELVTLAYMKADESLRSQFPEGISYRSVIDHPNEESLGGAFDKTEDVRFLVDMSIIRAVEGRISESVQGIPYTVVRQFPQLYAVLAFDRGDYDQAMSLISSFNPENIGISGYFSHLFYDALFLSAGKINRERAYEGYLQLAMEGNDWRPILNVLLYRGHGGYPALMETARNSFMDVPEVCRFLGDVWYTEGRTEESKACYRQLIQKRPDIIEAHLRLSELDQGYVTQGMLKEILWDMYYETNTDDDTRVKVNAQCYLLWLAIGTQDKGIIDFFSGQTEAHHPGNLLLGLWDLLHNSPAGCLDRLGTYKGPHQWYSLYLQGTACLALGIYDRGLDYFEKAVLLDGADRQAVVMKKAQCLYFAGEFRDAVNVLKNGEFSGEYVQRAHNLERKILEKL